MQARNFDDEFAQETLSGKEASRDPGRSGLARDRGILRRPTAPLPRESPAAEQVAPGRGRWVGVRLGRLSRGHGLGRLKAGRKSGQFP